MRKAGIYGLPLLVLAGAAHAQGDPRPHLAVRSGGSVVVNKYVSINPDCSSRGEMAVNLLEGPQGGQVSVAHVRDYVAFAPANPRSACNRRKLAATEIVYRAAPGFSGYDTFKAEVVSPDGVVVTHTYSVEVR